MNDAEIKTKLRDWVIRRSKQRARLDNLLDDTPVIEAGLLSSLDIVEVVHYIEPYRS